MKMDGANIEREDVNTFVGVIIDHNICWKPQQKLLNVKKQEASQSCETKFILDHKPLHILSCSLV